MFRRFACACSRYDGYLGVINKVDKVNNLVPHVDIARKVADINYGMWSVTSTSNKGLEVINDPHINKGTAFSPEERERLGLRGLLPGRFYPLDTQVERVKNSFQLCTSPIEKFDFAMQVADRNETLFFRWLMENVSELAPIIYTPTVGEACQRFGRVFKRPRGMYFSPDDQTHFLSMVHNWPEDNVEVIVVTDGGRILGLGDLGAHGMPIPVGKLALYTAIGGIHPTRTLPIMLDVGTDNDELRESPSYFGWPGKRLRGEEYYLMVDELMRSIKRRWPKCVVQFEDFTSSQAPVILETYKNRTLCFNDDIQGTGSVVVAGMINGLRVQKKSAADLAQTKIVIVGGGSAGYGVSRALLDAMVFEGASKEEALDNIYIVDIKGVLTMDRAKGTPMEVFAKDVSNGATKDGVTSQDTLAQVIQKVRPQALVGLTGTPGVFTREAVSEMARLNANPIIFPLSNPTSRAECTYQQAMDWTEGRCVFGSGSPFEPYEYKGKVWKPSQTNNMYIFPPIGLAAVLSGSTRIPDMMFHTAAKALAYSIDDEELQRTRCLFPGLDKARATTPQIALACIHMIEKLGLATIKRDPNRPWTESFIKRQMYVPRYGPIVIKHEQESFVQ